MTELLGLRSVFAGYSKLPVVRSLTLTLAEGEIVALLGPNGAGKSTTLLTISGLLPVLSGDIRVLGHNARSYRRPEKLALEGVSHVPEGRALFTALSVRDNLRLGSRSRTDHRRAVQDVLQYFPELDALMDRRAGLLSGGEQQMLAVGRALVGRPRLLMVDEMSLGLAPVVVHRLLNALPQIVAATGCGILLIEQHVQQALTIADRGYVLAHGELVSEGTAEYLQRNRAVLESTYLGQEALEPASELDPSEPRR